MSTYRTTIGGTAEEMIAEYVAQTPLNSGMEILNLSLVLIMGGHYREAMTYAVQVEPSPTTDQGVPEIVDRDTARAAHIAAAERAKPLFERAALDMDGTTQGGYVMDFYNQMLEEFRSGSGWIWPEDPTISNGPPDPR